MYILSNNSLDRNIRPHKPKHRPPLLWPPVRMRRSRRLGVSLQKNALPARGKRVIITSKEHAAAYRRLPPSLQSFALPLRTLYLRYNNLQRSLLSHADGFRRLCKACFRKTIGFRIIAAKDGHAHKSRCTRCPSSVFRFARRSFIFINGHFARLSARCLAQNSIY